MVVIDTSVAYKWFSTEKEEHLSQALSLLKAHLQNKEQILAPDLILYELANAWATKTALNSSHIRRFLMNLKKTKIKIEPVTFGLITKGVEFAKKYRVSAYDAVYVILAKEKQCHFLTADEKFIQRVNLSFVKSLRSYSA